MIIDGFWIWHNRKGWGGVIPETKETLEADTLDDLIIKIDQFMNGWEAKE